MYNYVLAFFGNESECCFSDRITVTGSLLRVNGCYAQMMKLACIVMGKRYKNADTTKVRNSITAIAGENDTVFLHRTYQTLERKNRKNLSL